MALKAGTVGIDPKYVDKNGKPISEAADLSNYYTKSETDTKLDLKANKSYLTANNKIFNFAYDSESGKYGYKAGAQDEFHPFESAGAGSPGWNKPADLITTGLTYENCSYVSGGYYIDETEHMCYLDIVVLSTGSGYLSIKDLPVCNNQIFSGYGVSGAYMPTQAEAEETYFRKNNEYPTIGYFSTSSRCSSNTSSQTGYYHAWGNYPIPASS